MVSTAAGEYVVLEVQLPGHPAEALGIYLLDVETDSGTVRLRADLESIADDELDLELLNELGDDLRQKSSELGGAHFLEWLESNASNVLRVSSRERVLVDSAASATERAYRKHVTPKVLPFRTHLPRFSLRAAAGKFGESMEVEPEGWEEIPAGLRLDEDMFVAHVAGRSMEPQIPDGSLCVFRGNVTGSRNGRLVLVMHYGEAGENRFTIKRYRSVKAAAASEEEGWRHQKIILEPLNPEFEPWELTPDSPLRVIGEFVRVLRPGTQADGLDEPTPPPR